MDSDDEEDGCLSKSMPLQIGVDSGSVELSPKTAAADTEGMWGLALTLLELSRGAACRRFVSVGFLVDTPSLNDVPREAGAVLDCSSLGMLVVV